VNLLDPCPDSRCTHDQDCAEGKRRRAHTVAIVPAGKMDAPTLVAAECSCGTYRSSPGSETRVRAAHADHAAAKLAAEAKRNRRCPTCGSEDPAVRLTTGWAAEDPATKVMTGCGVLCDDPSRWHATGLAAVQP
jgi:hypothetical protein